MLNNKFKARDLFVRKTPKGLLLKVGSLIRGDDVFPISVFIMKVHTKEMPSRTVYTVKPTWLEYNAETTKWERKFGDTRWVQPAEFMELIVCLETIEKES